MHFQTFSIRLMAKRVRDLVVVDADSDGSVVDLVTAEADASTKSDAFYVVSSSSSAASADGDRLGVFCPRKLASSLEWIDRFDPKRGQWLLADERSTFPHKFNR